MATPQAPTSPHTLVGQLCAVAGAELQRLEARGTGLVATLTVAGVAYRVQLDMVQPRGTARTRLSDRPGA